MSLSVCALGKYNCAILFCFLGLVKSKANNVTKCNFLKIKTKLPNKADKLDAPEPTSRIMVKASG